MGDVACWFSRSRAESVVPVVIVVALGAAWIAAHAVGGRAATHTLFQVLALGAAAAALLLRRRKPAGVLAGILVVYALVDLDTILILPVLVALATVAEMRGRQALVPAAVTAVVVTGMPGLHGALVSITGYTLPHLGAVALAAAAGLWLRTRRQALPQAGSFAS